MTSISIIALLSTFVGLVYLVWGFYTTCKKINNNAFIYGSLYVLIGALLRDFPEHWGLTSLMWGLVYQIVNAINLNQCESNCLRWIGLRFKW